LYNCKFHNIKDEQLDIITSLMLLMLTMLSSLVIDRLHATTTSHQVRRARLFSRWSVFMEQTARRHSRGTWHHHLSKTF